MTTSTPMRPWGTTRLTPMKEPTDDLCPSSMEIDGDTQMTTYRDAGGQPIQAGPKHGTSRPITTSSPTGGKDGQHGNPPDDANVTTYVPD
jgi:putative ATP-grasp target RiPP